jgi:dienelactone hydrolase
VLASRGYIVVAVDENFLNYGWHRYGDFKESDIDVRGWLVLQHLRQWKEWNSTKGTPFFNKVDLSHIALIGHSRGGEAIAAAAAFNRMKRYPKNGNVLFDFHYKIRTLVAFAPSDIYQHPYERTTPVKIKDVNYLLLLGTHDRQVPSILGSRIFQRVSFSTGAEYKCKELGYTRCKSESFIKAALYIGRANHSQFNTSWGKYDFPWPYRLFSNIAAQLSGDEQRQVVKTYVSAFLDTTLKGESRYIPLFRDYRLVQGWLPKTLYISRFQDSKFRLIGNFDEDIDPETTTLSGGRVIGQNLSGWHEQDIDPHYYLPYGSRSNRVVSVSWESQSESTPVFRLRLPEKQVRAWKLKFNDMLVFSIACPYQETPPEVTIELRDETGRVSQVPLEQVFPLQPPLSAYLTKMSVLEEPSPVIVLQTVAIPLSRFLALNPSIDLRKLQEVNFRFDGTRSGTVLLDDIGFDQPA